MHELSIAQNIVEIVQQNLPSRPFPGVKIVRMKIGDMAGVVTDSLEFCFSAIITGTEMEGAVLEIQHIPVVARCKRCGIKFPVEQYAFSCTQCHNPDIEVISGRELQVLEVELLEEEVEAG